MIRPDWAVSRRRLDDAVSSSQQHLLRVHTPADENDRPVSSGSTDLGYWLGELEADTTLESDYILFLYYLDPESHAEKIRKLAKFVKARQLPDGSWNIYPDGPGDSSATVKAYFALKLAGTSVEDPVLVRAREAIIAMGGVQKINSYTKIYLSFLNQVDWEDCPAIPPEIVLLPRFFYFNIYEMSYWSRAIVIPLSILYAKRPRRDVPANIHLEEVLGPTIGSGLGETDGADGGGSTSGLAAATTRRNGRRISLNIPRDPNLFSWKNVFLLLDRFLKIVEKTPMKPLRGLALKTAEKWMMSRLEDSDGLGAIVPAMVNSILAMKSLGYADDHPKVAEGLAKLRELEIEDGDEIRLQPCVSPVWDTALAMCALEESGLPHDHEGLVVSARWLVSKEARRPGDWRIRKPDVEASGWYFQFNNEFYPDIDDTAAVLMALKRTSLDTVAGGEDSIRRGLDWILSLQCTDGGWAAFDVDVDHELLTRVPFADHNAMLDPACADITGRVLEMLGAFPELHKEPRIQTAIERAVAYLEKEQDESGSWYGRWGVNYIYGTCHALKGLAAVGVKDTPMIRRAVDWLKSCQDSAGGWGESCESYADPTTKGQGRPTASQTAWAVMGLVAVGDHKSESAQRGIRYLIDSQKPDGSWEETDFTGTGFPLVFYLKYHLYSQYFPLFALGAYRNAVDAEDPADAPTAGERRGRAQDPLAASVDDF